MDNEMLLKLWAKTSKGGDGNNYHPLLFHMLDVAAVAGLIWDNCLAGGVRKRLEDVIGIDARTQVMFLSGAHDIGKASPGFQKKVPKLSKYCGLRFSENDLNRPHGFISAHVLREFIGSYTNSVLLSQIAGGHHGVFPRSVELCMGRDILGDAGWIESRRLLLVKLADILGLNVGNINKSNVEVADPFIVPSLAGFISITDWIGSNQDFFPCIAECGRTVEISTAEYWDKMQEKAQSALEKLGWLPSVTFAVEEPFNSVFNDFAANTLQQTVFDMATEQASPYLMIVEAPMGQGKTEAALYAADLAMCRGFARGMYIAMPTQATGNAMFKRVSGDYLEKRSHTGKLNLQLVHGNALLTQMAEVKHGEIPAFEPRNIDSGQEDSDTEAQSWFTAKKRPLLAPFGVGTIDQSLLSVLQTSHWFVRLFGLTDKVIIFDEVHAYDAYMSTILERLLRWLAEMDCTVILLSATLPEVKRKAFARAYSGQDDLDYKRYPRITLTKACHYPNKQSNHIPVCKEVDMGNVRRIDLDFAKMDLDSITKILSNKLENCGCAAVICNTVNRSIEVYEHLRDTLKDTECLLFHARTLQMWRREREEEVLRKFGKGDKQVNGMYVNQSRPKRAILVATQVIEQSLDLDFDLMVSEIAPIDLLLQRLGRLHRHLRQRPKGLEMPYLVVLCDAKREGSPPETFGKSIEHVYDRYILLRTWLALRELNHIEVPTEIEGLIEVVYGEDVTVSEDGWFSALQDAQRKMEFGQTESEKSASRLLVVIPRDPFDLVEEFNDQLIDDEDPEVHRSVRAATREGDPAITVVIVGTNWILTPEPTIVEIRELLDRSAKLSHKGLYYSLATTGIVPSEWARNAHLRHTRLLRLDEQNQVRVESFVLTVDEKLGIVIQRENANND